MKGLLSRVIRPPYLSRERIIILIHLAATKIFPIVEKYLKLHVTPAHFYSPIPITYALESSVFNKRFECVGLDWNLDEQFRFLNEIVPKYLEEYTPENKGGLSRVDALILYAMIREEKPKLMIEVGGGESTKISLRALRKNRSAGYPFKFYSIEPYPKDKLRELDDHDFSLIEDKVQNVSNELLTSADLLFIDSSHVSKIDSDVNCEILEIVPKLKVGSVIHWHDIVIPRNYWKEWIRDGNKFWNESYMVHSFMLFNETFKIIWSAAYLQLEHFKSLHDVVPYSHKNDHLMSFWIRREK